MKSPSFHFILFLRLTCLLQFIAHFVPIPHLQLLNSATPDTLQDALRSLKERSQWLEDQQTIEFSRMRSLNMLPEAVNHGHNVAFNTTSHAPNSAPEQYITTLNGIGNDKNVSPTPEIATVPSLPAAELAAAVEHHQLTRDSTTPPNLASIEAKATKSGKKGPVKKSQRKLKRKRTN